MHFTFSDDAHILVLLVCATEKPDSLRLRLWKSTVVFLAAYFRRIIAPTSEYAVFVAIIDWLVARSDHIAVHADKIAGRSHVKRVRTVPKADGNASPKRVLQSSRAT